MKMVDRIFAQFDFDYGPVWSNKFMSDEDLVSGKQIWAQSLESMSDDDVTAVLKHLGSGECTEYAKFPPSRGEFQRLLKVIKCSFMPGITDAYESAAMNSPDKHPIVKKICSTLNMEITNSPRHVSEKIFKDKYRAYLDRMCNKMSLDEVKAFSSRSDAKMEHDGKVRAAAKLTYVGQPNVSKLSEQKSPNHGSPMLEKWRAQKMRDTGIDPYERNKKTGAECLDEIRHTLAKKLNMKN